jgi:hypothetical protein
MSELTHLEQAVLHAILAGSHPALEALRDQLHGLEVARRIAGGTSFSTVLRPDPALPRAPIAARRTVIDDLMADVPGLARGAAFALFVEDGRLARLEGTTFGGEPWPDDLAGLTLHHDGEERDLSELDPPD